MPTYYCANCESEWEDNVYIPDDCPFCGSQGIVKYGDKPTAQGAGER